MVLISRLLLRKNVLNSPGVRRFDQRWCDRIRLYVIGGHGGNGLPKIGGIGGSGGNVILEACDKVKSLEKIVKDEESKRIKADDGGHSRKVRLLGETGESKVIKVPVGISVTTDEGEELADLCKTGEQFIAARGGMGGIEASQFLGSKGERRPVRLNLKLLGDVGFVGFPNAGKSTLLRGVSRAKPKIANYPFTTLRPNVGICDFEDLRRISFVDLPGLIEGAHENLGMGHSFLKHVERTRILLFVVDINGFQFKPSSPVRSAFETVVILNKELELYKRELLDKPAVCVATKMDLPNAKQKFKLFKESLSDMENVIHDPTLVNPDFVPEKLIKFTDVIPISAKHSPKSVTTLKEKVRDAIDEYEVRQKLALVEDLDQSVQSKLAERSTVF
eukprot:TRINITY_DN5477_c0_g1_i4.p1 TRINITY_DN5477_c0_g1~~TRINITY_DN5477_c0_g1_i4.p1  ORF type:complete len:390 (+),score=58.40 TRINITY_DN5477_c0_g1_i4:74-1243(+)